ncbi:MAG: hypothetical protein KAU21_15415, partial [Gammaproteobacteria bacterium]|nr:hypothetical protein [Gammaproteobacteria bacterium]
HHRHELDFSFKLGDESCSVGTLCEYYYELACSEHNWSLVRRMADLLGKVDSRVEDSLLDIIIRQKRLAVGRAYSEKTTLSVPLSNERIMTVIRQFSGKAPAESILSQEILLHLGYLLKTEPELFENILTLRLWHLIEILVGKIGREQLKSFTAAYEHLLTIPPNQILSMLQEVMGSFSSQLEFLQNQDLLAASGIPSKKPRSLDDDTETNTDITYWEAWRKKAGGLVRLSPQFYIDIWHVLKRCNGIVIGDKYNPGCRVGAEITHDSTPGERSFELLIEGEINNIDSPAYRQLNIELIKTLIFFLKENPQLNVEGDITLDIIIGYAVKLSWQQEHPGNYDEQREQAWNAFYYLSPTQVQNAFVEAIWHLLTSQQAKPGN